MRHGVFVVVVGAGIVLAGLAWRISGNSSDKPTTEAKGKSKDKLKDTLPIKQVVLFNSGVGYFQREGEVEGNTRVPLTFPAGEIDDLLKSLVLEDRGGRINSVNFDSHDPIDKILRSFVLDLNNNPTFGQILNQARGEKIEALRLATKDGQPAKIAGTIVGMEVQRQSVGKDGVAEVEFLNLDGPQGLQSIPLSQVIGVRFLNSILESEFRRALQVLASSHDTQKKSVSLGFSGDGKRQVKVGYVVERPIWKTTYRLRLEPNGKLFLQGWGLIENTSDDDWNDIRLVLVSGRPISYKMNLYEPLYIPRPTVEPDLFASLRPPVYGGDLSDEMKAALGNIGQSQTPQPFNQFLGGGMNALGGSPIGGMQLGNIGQPPPLPLSEGRPGGWGNMGSPMAGMNLGGMNMGMMGMGGMNMGMMGGFTGGSYLGGSNSGVPGGGWNIYQNRSPAGQLGGGIAIGSNRLTYEELQKRRQFLREERQKAGKIGPSVAGLNFKEGIASVASAEEVGNYFQYVVDQKVSLPRQKSAMLPILNQTIEGAKVSIFNESVHARYPLLGVRLKNTSDMPLTQGPVTVFEDGAYAGDTRILDLQPGETRLLSFALDQGTEVATQDRASQNPDIAVKISDNQLSANYKIRETKSYIIKNRSLHDRLVVVEHPLRAGWKLITPAKPLERTRDRYRFQTAVSAGKLIKLDVTEEQEQVEQIDLKAPSNRFLFARGLEIEPVSRVIPGERLEVKIVDKVLFARHTIREAKTYFVRNQSGQERIVEVEHIVRPGWKLAGKMENGPKSVRFKLTAANGKTASHEVAEEKLCLDLFSLQMPEGAPPRYVLALGLEVRPEATLAPEQLTGLKIAKGVLKADLKVRHTQRLFVKNNADKDRVFAFEHMVRPEWKRLGPDDEVQAGPAIYRFELAVAAGKTASKEIIEERAFTDKDRPLKSVTDQVLQDYLGKRALSQRVRTALNKVLSLQAKRAETDRQLAETVQQLRAVSEDQTRLRANLGVVPQSAEPYKKFLGKLVIQEEQIDGLQQQSRQLQATAQRLTREYESYIADLDEE